MITEKRYLEAKKLIADYEAEQLNKHNVSGSVLMDEKQINKLRRKFDFWCGCIVRDEREISYFRICNMCGGRCDKTDR